MITILFKGFDIWIIIFFRGYWQRDIRHLLRWPRWFVLFEISEINVLRIDLRFNLAHSRLHIGSFFLRFNIFSILGLLFIEESSISPGGLLWKHLGFWLYTCQIIYLLGKGSLFNLILEMHGGFWGLHIDFWQRVQGILDSLLAFWK